MNSQSFKAKLSSAKQFFPYHLQRPLKVYIFSFFYTFFPLIILSAARNNSQVPPQKNIFHLHKKLTLRAVFLFENDRFKWPLPEEGRQKKLFQDVLEKLLMLFVIKKFFSLTRTEPIFFTSTNLHWDSCFEGAFITISSKFFCCCIFLCLKFITQTALNFNPRGFLHGFKNLLMLTWKLKRRTKMQ